MQLDSAASLKLIDSGAINCFVQRSEILNSWAMIEGSKLKTQLTTGHEFRIETKCLLPIAFDPGLEHVVDYYVVNKLTTPVILGMQWLQNYNPQVDWPNYVLTLQNSSGK